MARSDVNSFHFNFAPLLTIVPINSVIPMVLMRIYPLIRPKSWVTPCCFSWLIGSALSISMLTYTIALKSRPMMAQLREPPESTLELPLDSPSSPVQGTGFLDQPDFAVAERWRRASISHTLTGFNAAVDSLVFSPDSQSLVAGGSSSDPRIKVWSVATGEELFQIRAQRSAILAMVLSPNGEILATGGEDDTVQLWSWAQASKIATFLRHKDNIMSLAITPDGEVLVSGGLDGIKVWSLIPQRPLYTLTPLGYPALTLAVHPNGYILASGDHQGEVTFWNLRTGLLIPQNFTPHQARMRGLIFTPNGDRLITCSDERDIKVWDLTTGELLHTLAGHTGPIRAISLHPDGETLASASNDGIRLWSLRTGDFLVRYDAHKDWVQTVAFSPDGEFLATGGFDFTVKLWKRAPMPTPPSSTEEIPPVKNVPGENFPDPSSSEGPATNPTESDLPLQEIDITPALP